MSDQNLNGQSREDEKCEITKVFKYETKTISPEDQRIIDALKTIELGEDDYIDPLLAKRAKQEILSQNANLPQARKDDLANNNRICMGYVTDLMFDKDIPNASVYHRMSPKQQLAILGMQLRDPEKFEEFNQAEDKIGYLADKLFEDPTPQMVAFYQKKVGNPAPPQIDALQMAIDAENEQDGGLDR